MGILKDKVIFCKKCGSYHRNSYECSPVNATKKAEVVLNLADIKTVDETVVSVTSPKEEVVLPEVELVKDAEEEKKVVAPKKPRTRKPSQKNTTETKESKPNK